MGLEGIVSKRKNSAYRSGRSPDWLKSKNPACRGGEAGGYDSRGMSMGNTLRSILTRLVAYVAVVIAAGLLFLAGATVYELMWPRPVVPFSQMSHSS
jgi:hypothetical protein